MTVPPETCEEEPDTVVAATNGPEAQHESVAASEVRHHRWWIHELEDLRARARQYRARNEGSDGLSGRLRRLGDQQNGQLRQARLARARPHKASEATPSNATAAAAAASKPFQLTRQPASHAYAAGLPSGVPNRPYGHFCDDMYLDAESQDHVGDDLYTDAQLEREPGMNEHSGAAGEETTSLEDDWVQVASPRNVPSDVGAATPTNREEVEMHADDVPTNVHPPRIPPSPFARRARNMEFQALVPEARVLGQGEEVSRESPRLGHGGIHIPKLRLRVPQDQPEEALPQQPVELESAGWQLDSMFEDEPAPRSRHHHHHRHAHGHGHGHGHYHHQPESEQPQPHSHQEQDGGDIRAVVQGLYPVVDATPPAECWYPLQQDEGGATAGLATSTLLRAQERRRELGLS